MDQDYKEQLHKLQELNELVIETLIQSALVRYIVDNNISGVTNSAEMAKVCMDVVRRHGAVYARI
jgi:hypothetical protein